MAPRALPQARIGPYPPAHCTSSLRLVKAKVCATGIDGRKWSTDPIAGRADDKVFHCIGRLFRAPSYGPVYGAATQIRVRSMCSKFAILPKLWRRNSLTPLLRLTPVHRQQRLEPRGGLPRPLTLTVWRAASSMSGVANVAAGPSCGCGDRCRAPRNIPAECRTPTNHLMRRISMRILNDTEMNVAAGVVRLPANFPGPRAFGEARRFGRILVAPSLDRAGIFRRAI